MTSHSTEKIARPLDPETYLADLRAALLTVWTDGVTEARPHCLRVGELLVTVVPRRYSTPPRVEAVHVRVPFSARRRFRSIRLTKIADVARVAAKLRQLAEDVAAFDDEEQARTKSREARAARERAATRPLQAIVEARNKRVGDYAVTLDEAQEQPAGPGGDRTYRFDVGLRRLTEAQVVAVLAALDAEEGL